MLLPHQNEGIAHLLNNPRAMLGDDMGLGKTRQAILAAQQRRQNGIILIVCPAIARIAWVSEFQKLNIGGYIVVESVAHLKSLKLSNYKWVVISLPLLRSNAKTFDRVLANVTLDVMVLDEAHTIKDIKSASNKVVNILAMRATNYWALSGTFVKNDYSEFFANVRLVIPHTVLARAQVSDYWSWRNRFTLQETKMIWTKGANGKPVQRQITNIVGSRNAPILRDLIKPYFLRRKKADVLPDLPELMWQPLPIEITHVNRTAEEISSAEDAARTGRLEKHIATMRAEAAMRNVPAAVEIIKKHCESDANPILVFCSHLDPLYAIQSSLPNLRVAIIDGSVNHAKRQQIERDYQEGHLDALLGQTQACGVALTLTRGNRVLFVDLAWTPADNAQARDRAHRIGQTSAVLAQYLDPIGDEVARRVNAILAQKTREIAQVL